MFPEQSNILTVPAQSSTISTILNSSLGYLVTGSVGDHAYPTANRAYWFPFRVVSPIVAKIMFIRNGAVLSGNIDLGIYSIGGTRLVSSGSTLQAGTSAIQTIDITDTRLGAGVYYFGWAVDNTTAQFTTAQPGAPSFNSLGCARQNTAFPLPATWTPTIVANFNIPILGLSTNTTL